MANLEDVALKKMFELQEENSRLIAQLEAAQKEASEQESRANRWMTGCELAREERDCLQGQLAVLRHDIERHVAITSEQAAEIEKLEAQLAEAQAENENLANRIEMLIAPVAVGGGVIADLRRQNLKLQQDCIELHEVNEVVGKANADLRHQLAEATRNRCDKCGARCIDNCLRCGAPQCCPKCCANDDLRHKLDEQKILCDGWLVIAEAKEGDIQTLQARLAEKDEALDKVQRLNMILHGEVAQLTKTALEVKP